MASAATEKCKEMQTWKMFIFNIILSLKFVIWQPNFQLLSINWVWSLIVAETKMQHNAHPINMTTMKYYPLMLLYPLLN